LVSGLAGRALAFEYGDASLPRVNGDENSLLQLDHLKAVWYAPRFEVCCAWTKMLCRSPRIKNVTTTDDPP
jgi:hypothetical protein